LKKLDTVLTTPKPVFENDAAEIGKGHEFITQTFPSHNEVANRIEKYASAEFVTWAAAFALGNVAQTHRAREQPAGEAVRGFTECSYTRSFRSVKRQCWERQSAQRLSARSLACPPVYVQS